MMRYIIADSRTRNLFAVLSSGSRQYQVPGWLSRIHSTSNGQRCAVGMRVASRLERGSKTKLYSCECWDLEDGAW